MLPAPDHWPPRSRFISPHPILALVWRGEIERARELLEKVPERIKVDIHQDLWQYLEAWLLLVEGDVRGAELAADRAVSHSRRTGFGFESVCQILEARALLEMGRSAEAADLLNESLTASRTAGLTAYAEWALTIMGKVALQAGDDNGALVVLRESVGGMQKAKRQLMLPIAGIYLAEAERRLGEVDRAERAAQVAHEAAASMSSFFMLQQSLNEFPSVLELMRQCAATGEWLKLSAGRNGGQSQYRRSPEERSRVVLQPFGSHPHILIGDDQIEIRRLKVLEFIALLANNPNGIPRDDLQLALFPESDRYRGSNHFRQIAHQLRKRYKVELERTSHGHIGLAGGVIVQSVDRHIQEALTRGRTLVGVEKLDVLKAVIDSVPGQYLERSDLDWAVGRRFEFQVLLEEATKDAAHLALQCKDFELARRYALEVIKNDAYAEDAYLTLIDIEWAIGTESGVAAIYRKLADALHEIGLSPHSNLPARLASKLDTSRSRPA